MEELINKLLAESPMAAALIVCAYMLRPILKMYLDQQIEQLKRIGDLVAELKIAQVGFDKRLDRVEEKIDHIVQEQEQQHVVN